MPTKNDEDLALDGDIEALVFQTELIIQAEDGGFKTNWNLYDAELGELVIEWRKAEKDLNLLFSVRQQSFIKAHYK